jgi:hypothetical protein
MGYFIDRVQCREEGLLNISGPSLVSSWCFYSTSETTDVLQTISRAIKTEEKYRNQVCDKDPNQVSKETDQNEPAL